MENKHKIFFVGIGGISMSGLAKYLKSNGYDVLGSDQQNNEQVQELKNMGVKIFHTHKKSNVDGCELVVATSAIKQDNSEIVRAKEMGVKVLSRSELLRLVSKEFDHVIAVAGTHGKTTTTAMIGEILYLAGLNPTVHIGGVSKNLDTNFLIGDKNFFVTEACEYKDNFLSLTPEVSVITNVEEDHMDYFKTKQNLKNSFEKFVEKSSFSIVSDQSFTKNRDSVVCLGRDGGYCWAENIEQDESGKYSFDAYYCDEFVGRIKLDVMFLHNVTNALNAVAVAKYYKIKNEVIVQALSSFCGVKRRFETKGEVNGTKVVIDYAHHPTEIRATIKGAKEICNKLFVVFQPHTYSRTKKLLNEFEACFDQADALFLFKTYAAREPYDKSASAKFLQKHIKNHKKCEYFANFLPISQKLKKITTPGDMILILGAGDIEKLGDYLTCGQ